MSTRPPRDSSDEEIEAFAGVCDQLAGFDARLSPEWIDGYLSALAGGPRAPSLDECLPTMTGDVFDRVFADPEDRERALAALRRRFAVIADQLDGEQLDDDPDRLRLAPYMIEWTDEARAAALEAGEVDAAQAQQLVTGGDWADGFFEALQRHEAHFQADAGEDDVAVYLERLQQVHVLRLALDSDELARHLKATYGDEGADRARLVDEACYAVQDMRLWWADHLPRPETRRTGKTPGRNDPCPCGSGKKYKKCHGA